MDPFKQIPEIATMKKAISEITQMEDSYPESFLLCHYLKQYCKDLHEITGDTKPSRDVILAGVLLLSIPTSGYFTLGLYDLLESPKIIPIDLSSSYKVIGKMFEFLASELEEGSVKYRTVCSMNLCGFNTRVILEDIKRGNVNPYFYEDFNPVRHTPNFVRYAMSESSPGLAPRTQRLIIGIKRWACGIVGPHFPLFIKSIEECGTSPFFRHVAAEILDITRNLPGIKRPGFVNQGTASDLAPNSSYKSFGQIFEERVTLLPFESDTCLLTLRPLYKVAISELTYKAIGLNIEELSLDDELYDSQPIKDPLFSVLGYNPATANVDPKALYRPSERPISNYLAECLIDSVSHSHIA